MSTRSESTFGKAAAERKDLNRSILKFLNDQNRVTYWSALTNDGRRILQNRAKEVNETAMTLIIERAIIDRDDGASAMLSALTESLVQLTEQQVFTLVSHQEERYLLNYPKETWEAFIAQLIGRSDRKIASRGWAENLATYYGDYAFAFLKDRPAFAEALTTKTNCSPDDFEFIINATAILDVHQDILHHRVRKCEINKAKAEIYLAEYKRIHADASSQDEE